MSYGGVQAPTGTAPPPKHHHKPAAPPAGGGHHHHPAKPKKPKKPKNDPLAGLAPEDIASLVRHDTHAKFGDPIAAAKTALSEAKRTPKALDLAYQDYLGQHAQAQTDLHAQDQAALNQSLGGAADAMTMARQGNAGVDQRAAALGAQGQAPDLAGQVSGVLGYLGANAATLLHSAGILNEGQMQRAGENHAVDYGNLKAQAAQGVAGARQNLQSLRLQRGDFRAQDSQAYQKAAAEQELAVQSLLSGNQKALLAYKAAIKKLGVDKAIAQLSANTTIATNNADNATSAANNAADNAEKHWETRVNAANRIDVAKIRGAAGGAGNLSPADLKKTRRIAEQIKSVVSHAQDLYSSGNFNDQHIRSVIQRSVTGNNPNATSALMALARKHGHLTRGQKQAIASLFPNGHIPGVLKALISS